MIHFETIKRNLAMCLYYPDETNIFGIKRVVATFAAFLAVASFFAYPLYEADSMEEYVFSAYFITTLFGVFCSFIHTSFKTEAIFKLADNEMMKISRFEIGHFLLYHTYRHLL